MGLPSLRGLLGAQWTTRHCGEIDRESVMLVGDSGYSAEGEGKEEEGRVRGKRRREGWGERGGGRGGGKEKGRVHQREVDC